MNSLLPRLPVSQIIHPSSLQDSEGKPARESANSLTSLNRLPNELLICVAECVLPDDIANFSATCRLYRKLASRSLQAHRFRNAMYSKVKVGSISKVLFCVCTRPWNALYPKDLTVEVDRNLCEYWNPCGKHEAGFVNEFSETAAVIAELDAIAERIPLVAVRGLWPWLNLVLKGNKDPMISLVLTTLPNIEELVIRVVHYNQLQFTRGLVRSIISAGAQHRILSRLSKLTISHKMDRNFQNVNTLDLLMPFMTLPTLRKVDVSQAISRSLKPRRCRTGCPNVT